jgi:hypothetical protein
MMMENFASSSLRMPKLGACSSSIISPLGSFHHALFINAENFYTHIKDMEKVLIKLVVVQSYHENEWNQVIINKENNNC